MTSREKLAYKVQDILARELSVDHELDILGTGPASFKIADLLADPIFLPSDLTPGSHTTITDFKPLEWSRHKALIGYKLLAFDPFGHEFSRIDLKDETTEAEITERKEAAEREYRSILSVVQNPSAGSQMGGEFQPAGRQWRMKNPAFGHWSEWREGKANFSSDSGVVWQEREVFAVVFADTDPEARFVADANLSCPHCGGSGHKDDIRYPEPQVMGIPAGWKLVPLQPSVAMMNAVTLEMRGKAPWIEQGGTISWERADQNKIYRAMVEAAPEPEHKENSSFVPVPNSGTVVPPEGK